MADIHILKVTLTDWEARVRGYPYRILAVAEDDSLYDLAYAINEAFDFDFDHAFGFFDNLKNPYRSQEKYELFADMDDEAFDDEELAEAFEEEFGNLSEEEQAMMEQFADYLENAPAAEVKELLRQAALEGVPEADREEAEAMLEASLSFLDDEDETTARGVKESLVSSVFTLGKKLLYLFDYGDEWRFIVECQKVEKAEPRKHYPKLLEAKGEAPEQYPDEDFDEEDWEDMELEGNEDIVGWQITDKGVEEVRFPRKPKGDN
jgi:hypothetical protein